MRNQKFYKAVRENWRLRPLGGHQRPFKKIRGCEGKLEAVLKVSLIKECGVSNDA